MREAETLRLIAELAIAITGFSGVVVVVRSRVHDSWETGRLWMLLIQALGAAFFAFVPLLLETAGFSVAANWRCSNGALGLFQLAVIAGVAFTNRSSRHHEFVWPGTLVTMCVTGASIGLVEVVHALGGVPSLGAFIYEVALVWLLAMACLNFALFVLRGPLEQ